MLGLRPLQLFSSSTAQYQLFPVAKKLDSYDYCSELRKRKRERGKTTIIYGEKTLNDSGGVRLLRIKKK